MYSRDLVAPSPVLLAQFRYPAIRGRRLSRGNVGNEAGQAADRGHVTAWRRGGFGRALLRDDGARKAELCALPSAALAACATGRTAPESEISPKYTASAGSGALASEETSAAATARSAAGSLMRRPPATLR